MTESELLDIIKFHTLLMKVVREIAELDGYDLAKVNPDNDRVVGSLVEKLTKAVHEANDDLDEVTTPHGSH